MRTWIVLLVVLGMLADDRRLVVPREEFMKACMLPFPPYPQALREGGVAGVVAGLAPNGAVPAPSGVPGGG